LLVGVVEFHFQRFDVALGVSLDIFLGCASGAQKYQAKRHACGCELFKPLRVHGFGLPLASFAVISTLGKSSLMAKMSSVTI
jgi:hypothetical protein